MKKTTSLSHFVVTAALISAAYAVLTYVSAVLGLAYGNIQFRLSEALNILAAFTPAAVPGLMIGCVIGNMASPLGLIDAVVGAAATGLSAVAIRLLARCSGKLTPYISILPPVVFNAVLIGLEIVWFLPGSVTWVGFTLTALEVALGELAVCTVLGLPIYFGVKRYSNRLLK